MHLQIHNINSLIMSAYFQTEQSEMIISFRIKENELVREQEKMEEKKDGENMQRLHVQHQWERRMEKERQAEQKRDLMQAHMVEFWQARVSCR